MICCMSTYIDTMSIVIFTHACITCIMSIDWLCMKNRQADAGWMMMFMKELFLPIFLTVIRQHDQRYAILFTFI